MAARGKTRRTCTPDSPLLGHDSPDAGNGDATMVQFGMNSSQFSKDCAWGGVSGASDILELNRRCFSCCNLVLQLYAGINGNDRKMVRVVAVEDRDSNRDQKSPLYEASFEGLKVSSPAVVEILHSVVEGLRFLVESGVSSLTGNFVQRHQVIRDDPLQQGHSTKGCSPLQRVALDFVPQWLRTEPLGIEQAVSVVLVTQDSPG